MKELLFTSRTKRRLFIWCLLLVIGMAVLFGCQKGPLNQSRNKDKSSGGDQQGYLYSDADSAWFLTWAEINNRLNGQLTGFYLKGKSKKTEETSSHPFEGISDGTNLSLNFTGSKWTEALAGQTWTGTIKGKRITLIVPVNSGTLESMIFEAATVEEYNQAVQSIKESAHQSNEKLRRNTDMEKANDTVASMAASLTFSVKKLGKSSCYDAVFKDFSQAWKKMQQDYTVVKQKAEVKPMNSYDFGEVQYALGTLEYDLGTIEYNSRSFDYESNNVKDAINAVRTKEKQLSSAWVLLQKAETDNYNGERRTQFLESDIQKLISEAEIAVQKESENMKQAKAKRDEYVNDARQLFGQAKIYVRSLKTED